MNELLDEDASVIARLRSALDEVTAESDGLVAIEAQRPKVGSARWMAAAAAVVLIVGAVSVLVVHRNNAPDPASTPTELPTTSATEPELIRKVAPRYTLIADDLAPGQVKILPNMLTNETSMVWARGGSPADALFILRSGPGSPNMAPADTSLATYQMIGDQAVAVSSYSIGVEEQGDLLALVQPGSGLPWLLPVEGWSYLGTGTGNDGPTYEQTFSSDNGAVTLGVGPLANQFLTLATIGTVGSSIEQTMIAGHIGWKATSNEGAYALWPAGDSGQWASMTISRSLLDRVEGLIAAVAEVPANQVTVETALAPTVDTAFAETIPTPSDPTASDPASPAALTVGDVLTGELLPDAIVGPTLFVFVSPSCVPCNDAVEELVTKGRADESRVPRIALVIAEPFDEVELNAWLQELGWSGIVIRDENNISGTQFGIEAVPSYVFTSVDSGGTILDLISGLFTSGTLAELGVD